jgi:hypothetical protein
MYYFDILEILEEHKRTPLTTFEIFLLVKRRRGEGNYINVKKQLQKMYVRGKVVDRWEERDPARPFSMHGYVYQLRYIKE